MRQIKFRGKSIKKADWVYGYYFYNGHEHGIVTNTAFIGSWEEVDPATVSQFTGLMDKNGKEIWEGDVIWYYQPYSEKWENHICQWDDKFACFGLFEVGNKWCKESDWMKIQEIEVIGNIHDSPSLTNH